MKFEFHWPGVSEKTIFQYIDGTLIRANLAKMSKVSLDLWTFL